MYVGDIVTLNPKDDCKVTNYCHGSSINYDKEAFHVEEIGHEGSVPSSIITSNKTYYSYKLTALKAGKYTVTCTVNYYVQESGGMWGTNYSSKSNHATYTITVKNVPVVESISIPSYLTMTLGDVYSFSPIIYETGASTTLRWISSNTSVATIDANGKLTTTGVGTTTIFCTASNGVSASCVVTVNPILATGVSLNQSSCELQKDKSVKLVATVAPDNATDKSVTWRSSDETVAVVASDGTVTGLKSGSCDITATTVGGSNKSASCLIKVYDVTSIGIPSSLQLTMGKTYQFEPTIIDSKATTTLTWKSTNPSVAEINSSGFLTAKAAGTATVTCTAHNGVFAQCEVTVKSNVILATGILLNKTSAEMEQGATLQLTATVSPSDATNKSVTWSSSSPDIAYVGGSGLVTAVKPGTCSIVATTLDGSNLSATCQVHVLAEAEPDIKQGMVVWCKEQYDVYDVHEVDCVSFVNFETSDTREYVDLGLPSGTLWATCNVGASKPEEYGDYFAWGETTGYNGGKTIFNWSTYIYCQGSKTTMTKYCNQSDYGYNGFTDNLTKLHPSDDAATINWGVSWCMPTHAQQMELKEKCTCQWTQRNGVNGLLVTGPNRRQIFLPAAGSRHDSGLKGAGTVGVYWSSSLNPSTNHEAYNEHFTNASNGFPSYGREEGFSVRPVRRK